jgi:hypothetical protein
MKDNMGVEADKEMVNHPSHYNQGSMECIDAIVGAYGVEEAKVFCKINAFKYLWRLGHKDAEEQEIGKIKWYLDKYVNLSKIHGKEALTYSLESITGFKVGDLVDQYVGDIVKPRRREIAEIIAQGDTIRILFTEGGCVCARTPEEIHKKLKLVK